MYYKAKILEKKYLKYNISNERKNYTGKRN